MSRYLFENLLKHTHGASLWLYFLVWLRLARYKNKNEKFSCLIINTVVPVVGVREVCVLP